MCYLSGCMDTTIRFWNNTGYELPGKEKALFRECGKIAKTQMRPKPINKKVGSKERQAWLGEYTDRITECMQEKEKMGE